jgi:hypothetical protein
MPTEQLTYAQIAERLNVSTEAARPMVKRHRLPRSRSNDGKTFCGGLRAFHHRSKPTTQMPVRARCSIALLISP